MTRRLRGGWLSRPSMIVALCLMLLVVSMPVAHAALLNLTHDANGNLVTGDGKYRTYNSKNQLVSVRDGNNASAAVLQTYVHHPTQEKMLVKKTYWSNGALKETVTYISDEFVRVVNSSGTYNTTYYFDGNADLIAQKNPDGTLTTLLNDIEGSVNVATNSTGGVIERTTYEPFGSVASGGTATRYTYEGKEADAVARDIDFEFRKYNSEWGLFTQPDHISQNAYDPQTLNRYAFERNNPYRYEDPTGHEYGSGGVYGGDNGPNGADPAAPLEFVNRVLALKVAQIETQKQQMAARQNYPDTSPSPVEIELSYEENRQRSQSYLTSGYVEEDVVDENGNLFGRRRNYTPGTDYWSERVYVNRNVLMISAAPGSQPLPPSQENPIFSVDASSGRSGGGNGGGSSNGSPSSSSSGSVSRPDGPTGPVVRHSDPWSRVNRPGRPGGRR